MARMQERHKPLAGITGKCSVPMWSGGCPDGFCDLPAFGEQYQGSFVPARYGPNNRLPYAPGLCCRAHGGPGETDTRFMRDGNMWMAFRPDFENLQESIAGFGETQEAAFKDLTKREQPQ